VATGPAAAGDAAKLAAAFLRELRAGRPGFELLRTRCSADRRHAVAEARWKGSGGREFQGRYVVNVGAGEATVFGMEGEAAGFERARPLLVSVISNFTPLGPAAKAAPAPAPLDLRLAERRLPDGSASLLVPAGWRLLGERGAVLAAPEGDGVAGFVATVAPFWGPSSVPHFSPPQIPGVIHAPYMKPVDALVAFMKATGSRDHRVLERAEDRERAAQATAFLRRGVDAEKAVLTFTSRDGVRCWGAFEVAGFQPLPSGQWGIAVGGIWAPHAELLAWLPGLRRVAESYAIDQRFAEEYVRAGMANAQRMARETSQKAARYAGEMRASSMASFRERWRSDAYIDYKRTGTIRGEQEWLSQAEGGVLYKSDHWGLSREGRTVVEGQEFNYYNFQGENPVTRESMTPVDVSREVYENVYGAYGR
jgi:hypothetical protein